MPQLHETLMGRKLMEHTLPEIALQLERIANAMENPKDDQPSELTQLKLKYKTLSELDPDPTSIHRMVVKIREEMASTLIKIKKLQP